MRPNLSLNHTINITPYIDILLVLLIIIMVIQPVEDYELRGRIPAPPSNEARAATTGVIVLTIDSQSNLAINRQSVSAVELGAKLFEIYAARVDKNLFVQGAPDLPFGSVVKVIDTAKGAGVGDVGLLTGTR